ncbi:MAG: glycogen synthase GlgA [Candidatus Eisenbacteria bacterium]|nr:glycogen synthase GlgA [Candidatus Eisenbacteria bacterium]
MHIVYVSSEVVPFAKTGGLADVAGALPRALARRGHSVSVILPYYKIAAEGGYPIERTEITVTVPMEGREETARLHRMPMKEKRGTFWFVDHPGFFGERKELYGTPEGDYPDNGERFAFFCKVVSEFLHRMGEPVDVVHCNDWQSALLPIYLKLWYRESGVLGGAASVLTIHNLAYQGSFPASDLRLTGLPESLYTPHGGLEFFGRVNFLKGGLLFADALTTVSRRYAEEIRTEEFGAGLDGVLRLRADRLHGIPNGIDASVWNPEKDPHIPSRYSAAKMDGKRCCKKALQKECGFEEDPSIPLVGMITRLADQKGLDITVEALRKLARARFQFVLLGTGDEKYHRIFERLGKRNPSRYGVFLRFDNPLAHRIEAGSDIFLMPSRYEPCGLNQLYSLRYGTVPVVRATGGLADTVTDAGEESLADGTATGFRFDEYDAGALAGALKRAFALFADRRAWLRLARTGMAQDWSWDRSASAYQNLYQEIVQTRRDGAGA